MLSGGSGADVLAGGAGDDTLDGGAGEDTAWFFGDFGDYLITYGEAGLTVAGSDGVDTLSGIEHLAFADRTVAVDSLEDSGDDAAPVHSIEARVSSGRDDVEQTRSGRSRRGDGDLDLGDGTATVAVGIRFAAVDIPQGATITAAYLQFQADETSAGAADLPIHGHDTDNAATFRFFGRNVTGRVSTDATVAWAPTAWSVGEAGLAQRTDDLKSIVQELVDRDGWAADNAIAFVITGSGQRAAESFNGDADAAPLLHVEYTVRAVDAPVDAPANLAPVAMDDSAATDHGVPVTIDVLANDSDPDGDTLMLVSATDGAHGTVAVNDDGTIG